MPCKLMMWFLYIKKKQITKYNPKGLHQKERAFLWQLWWTHQTRKVRGKWLLLRADGGSCTKSTKRTEKAWSIKRPHLHCLLVTACHCLILSQKVMLKSMEVIPLFCFTDTWWVLSLNVYLQYFETWNLERTFQLNDYNALSSDISSLDYSHIFYLTMELN